VGDLDNDGSLEAVINNQNEAPSLWKIAAQPAGNWVMFDLPVGSTVKLKAGGRTRVNEVRADGSYLSQHDRRLHFGVGAAKSIESVEITTASGESRLLTGLPLNWIAESNMLGHRKAR
jgi:hypothetical protein